MDFNQPNLTGGTVIILKYDTESIEKIFEHSFNYNYKDIYNNINKIKNNKLRIKKFLWPVFAFFAD